MPSRIRSALFIDFDNIFTGLLHADRRAAMWFLHHMPEWLDGLRSFGLPADTTRELSIRRAYLNPGGSLVDPTTQNRIYLRNCRPHLTRAGWRASAVPP